MCAPTWKETTSKLACLLGYLCAERYRLHLEQVKKAKKLLPWDQKLFDSQPGRSLKCALRPDTPLRICQYLLKMQGD